MSRFTFLMVVLATTTSLLGCGEEEGPDPCAASPCQNDGVCLAARSEAVCLCAPGYSGARCEVDVDDCDPDPCFNGGTCTDRVDGFTCACATGFSGLQCETDVDDCSATSCANGGVCVDLVDGFACACAAGFTGPTCEVDVDDCDPDPCFNGGTCTDAVDGFTCECLTGFWGTQCEAAIEPLAVTTPAPLAPAIVGFPYADQMLRTGGTSAAVWSIVPGGTNTAWLTIDPATGRIEGTPTAAELGPVSLTVRIEEPRYPENSAEATFAFDVIDPPPPSYQTSFEGACPAGWTLTGDWQCGVPSGVGPASAYDGTQCIGTQLAGPYQNLQTWAGTTATSPEIALPASLPQTLVFRAWIDTEGATYDGFGLQISTDGTSFTTLTSVTPAYPLTIAGQPAWGGRQAALGWQTLEADLAAYAGQTVRIRFAFQSDSSGTFPGVYVDDVQVVFAR